MSAALDTGLRASRFSTEAIAAAVEYVDAGDRVVVSPPDAPAPVGLVGPVGHELGSHNYGAAVSADLARAGINPPFAVMHSDSAADLPLLRLADEPALAAAPRADVRRVREGLGRDVRSVSWR